MSNIIKTLHPYEISVLNALEKETTVKKLCPITNLQEIQIKRAIQWLSNKGLITTELINKKNIILGKNGLLYKKNGLPEIRFLKSLTDEFKPISEIEKQANLDFGEVNIVLGTLKKKSAIDIKKEETLYVKLGPTAKTLLSKESFEELFLKKDFPIELDQLIDLDKLAYDTLSKRKDIVEIEELKDTSITITTQGSKIKKELKDYDPNSFTEKLTPELLKTGNWKDKEFRHYDVKSPVPKIYGGRKHPLTAIIEMVKEIFIEMGFEEMKGPMIETAFWCLDSMWIPQDHPAREVQDTFYLPYTGKLPSKELLEKVKQVHENGGNTGSKGYGYVWNPDIAKQLLMRTHTTATTYRYLYEQKLKDKPNAKYFYVGRVFRNEAIDATHLPEFHQVEGFVMDDQLTLKHLMGFIKAFYSKMGIDNIKFKVTYNPYTESSLEAMYYDKERNSWLELINSGMFRPESLAPYGITKPVVAWGLGLERLAMTLYKLGKLKDLLGPTCDVDWLKSYELQMRKD